MEAGIKIGLHNKFDIEVRDAKTNKLKQSVTAYNIVLDRMWNMLVSRSSFMGAIHIGTGTGTLSPSRTTLFTFLVGRSVTLDATSFSFDNMFRRVKIQLEPSEYVGSTITEVGVASSTTNTTLNTHAMLTDAEGNPISILKTATDVVIIYATVFFTIGDIEDYVKVSNVVSGSVTGNVLLNGLVGGTPVINTGIALGTFADNAAPTIPSSLRGGQVATKSVALTTNVGERKTVFPIRRFEIAEANGHIQEIGLGDCFNIQLPNENYTGTQYNDVPVPGQNGARDIFLLQSRNIDRDSVVVKVNGTEEEVEVLPIPSFVNYQVGNLGELYASEQIGSAFLLDGSKMVFGAFPSGNFRQSYANINALGYVEDLVPWTQTYDSTRRSVAAGISVVAFGSGDGLTSVGFSPYTGYSVYFISDIGTSNPPGFQLTGTNNIYTAIGAIGDVIIHCFVSGTSSSSVSSWRLGCTYYDGSSWQHNNNLFDQQSPAVLNCGQSSVNPVLPYIFVGGGTTAGSTARIYLFDVDLKTASLASFSDSPTYSRGVFSPDGNVLVLHGKTAGFSVYELDDGVWVKTTTLFTSSSEIDSAIHTQAMFVDGNTFVLGTTYLWLKLGGLWKFVITDAQGILPGLGNPIANSYYPGDGFLFNGTSGTRAMYKNNWSRSAIKFDIPPISTDEISVSYKVNGIHKTTNYVLDVSGYIQFGEG